MSDPPRAQAPRAHGGRSWIGAIGYLVFFDQLGSVVKPVATMPQPSSTRPFEQAFEAFSDCSDCSDAERAALCALRCCLAHVFSLANLAEAVGASRRPLYRHFFNLLPARQLDELVDFPVAPWDGDSAQLEITYVDLGRLEDLAADVRGRVLAAHAAGELELRRSALEIRHRYLFGHPAEIGIHHA